MFFCKPVPADTDRLTKATVGERGGLKKLMVNIVLLQWRQVSIAFT